MDEKILNISNLSFGYGVENIFNNINMDLNKGDFVALIGPNGAGKSSLIKLILGQLKAKSGSLNLNIDYSRVGYVPQLGMGSVYTFPITVGELIDLSIKEKNNFFKRLNNSKILDVLSQVGMEEKMESLYYKLSGGQRQRVLIAKALVSSPDFLILDEPTNGIDYQTRQSLYKLLKHLNLGHNISILMITHELNDVDKYINKLYKLEDGEIQRCR